MTDHRDLKNIIRERQARTGESYTAARLHVLRARDERLGLTPAIETPAGPLEAIVIKVNAQSARVRFLGETDEVTFRTSDAYWLIPGHTATVELDRRWKFRGDAYATGRVKGSRFELEKLGLEPLPLVDHGPWELETELIAVQPKGRRRKQRGFEMHPIAWDAVTFVTGDCDNCPTCDAADLARAGDKGRARAMLMDVLAVDLRCIDAHVGLGNLSFARSPDRALEHYQVALAIGEQSLGIGFDGLLPWSCENNRPFLRCLHGLGLCLWRKERFAEARRHFERILALNPYDNQGARFVLPEVERGIPWQESEHADPEDLQSGRPHLIPNTRHLYTCPAWQGACLG